MPAPGKRSRLLRWSLIAGAFVVIAIGGVAILFARNWPFTPRAVTAALQDRFARTVEIRNFRVTYFPPGFVAEGISFLHRKRKDLPPLITVGTLIVKTSYIGMLTPQKRLSQVQVIGLHVTVPPKSPDGQSSGVMPLTNSSKNDTLAIDEITTDDATIEFMSSRSDRDPFKMEIHRLTLGHVGQNGAISYRAALLNTEPPGEIRSTGQVGPWNEDEPASTPLSGSYTFDNAKLGVFKGIDGTLSSRGKFSGKLGHIESEGGVDIPDFHISGSNHPVHLSTEFRAVVDGTNGDTSLESVKSHFERTTALSSGSVTGQPGQHGKTLVLAMTVNDGRIDDLLNLVTEEKNPSMTGSVSFRATIKVPPGSSGFLTKLNLEGDFGVGNERFTNGAMQAPLNKLTESARGENKKQQAEDPETVLSNLKGHVSAKNGIATLSNVSFSAPGTFAQIRGTYNLLNNAVNLQGILTTNGKLSDTTTGIKAVVLKAVSPFLKKKTVTVVPFTVTGTSMKPSFALDLDAKRTF
ncbi:MAG: AsmA-like C-terminal region-containing protein [Bryobacteraceae bacterium]|jgi:hypothetical protein